VLRDKPAPQAKPAPANEFERRHAERFKGAIFDWMEFQRDGQPFPAPDPTARPAQQVVLQRWARWVEKICSPGPASTGLFGIPATMMLHRGSVVARTNAHPNLWTVTTDGASRA
jgi:hypothetical protein